jgi:hypothetical protein
MLLYHFRVSICLWSEYLHLHSFILSNTYCIVHTLCLGNLLPNRVSICLWIYTLCLGRCECVTLSALSIRLRHWQGSPKHGGQWGWGVGKAAQSWAMPEMWASDFSKPRKVVVQSGQSGDCHQIAWGFIHYWDCGTWSVHRFKLYY